MRTFSNFVLAVALLTTSAVWLIKPAHTAQAQTPTVGSFAAPQVVSALSGCLQPPGATLTFGVAWCFVLTGSPSDKMYFSENGSATWNVYPQPSSSGGITAITATAPVTATTTGSTVNITLPSAALKTQIDTLGLTAAASAVQ
jgi:hypothetical protein